MKKAISILGPTHTKKTELALSIFKEYPSNIISVDSVQIYKEANIGSNKPDQTILKKIRDERYPECKETENKEEDDDS